jgi:hypothetical protein
MLLGLVVLVVGAGVVGASGAFSSVQADRTVDLNTAGDRGALLGFNDIDNQIVTISDTDTSGETSVLQITSDDINADAKTVFAEAFEISNNGNEDINKVYVRDESNIGPGEAIDFRLYDGGVGSSIVGSSSSGADLGTGGTMTVAVVIDTRGATTGSTLDGIDDVTIVANDSQAL